MFATTSQETLNFHIFILYLFFVKLYVLFNALDVLDKSVHGLSIFIEYAPNRLLIIYTYHNFPLFCSERLLVT